MTKIFTLGHCSIHIGGSVGEHYIEVGIANARVAPLIEALDEFIDVSRDGYDSGRSYDKLVAAREALRVVSNP